MTSVWVRSFAGRAGLLLALLAFVPDSGVSQGLTQAEALRMAFPEPAVIERRTAFLEDGDLDRARSLAGSGVRMTSRVISYYVGFVNGESVGVAYFDAHRVRTLNEVLMIVVAPDGTIRAIEVLRFSEPPEYRAPDGWLDQFEGEQLDDALSTKGSIINLTGATLTSRATTSAARRVLAYHEVIAPLGERQGEEL